MLFEIYIIIILVIVTLMQALVVGAFATVLFWDSPGSVECVLVCP